MEFLYKPGASVEDLEVGECTLRGFRDGDASGLNLWLRVIREDNGQAINVGVAVVQGAYFVDGTGRKHWGMARGAAAADLWVVSPSINALSTGDTHPGDHPTESSIWHQNVVVRGMVGWPSR